MSAEQLALFSHDLAPLALNDVVRTPEGWIGEICQIWPGRDHYVVFSFARCTFAKPLPVFRRDELELLPGVDRSEVWR